MGWGRRTGEAEATLDEAVRKAIPDEETATDLIAAIKGWVTAYVEEEKSDLRDQINKVGEWDPDY